MGKSTGNIEFDAYVGYLKKVTVEPADPVRLKSAVLKSAVENTEMQNALVLLKRLTMAAAIVLVCAIWMAWLGLNISERRGESSESIWYSARIDGVETDSAVKLYHAYNNSISAHNGL